MLRPGDAPMKRAKVRGGRVVGGEVAQCIFVSVFLTVFHSIFLSVFLTLFLRGQRKEGAGWETGGSREVARCSLSSVFFSAFSVYFSLCFSLYFSVYSSLYFSVYSSLYFSEDEGTSRRQG